MAHRKNFLLVLGLISLTFVHSDFVQFTTNSTSRCLSPIPEYFVTVEYEDYTMPPGDDDYALFDAGFSMRFLGEDYKKFLLWTNGKIVLGDEFVLTDYNAHFDSGPLDPYEPAIVPYFTDIDARDEHSEIHASAITEDDKYNRLDQITQIFSNMGIDSVKLTKALVFTWINVAYYDALAYSSLSSNRNTFQAIITYDEVSTYTAVIFLYGNIQFDGGTSYSDCATTEGIMRPAGEGCPCESGCGKYPRIGLSGSGDTRELEPYSGTDSALDVELGTNIEESEISGYYLFVVGEGSPSSPTPTPPPTTRHHHHHHHHHHHQPSPSPSPDPREKKYWFKNYHQ